MSQVSQSHPLGSRFSLSCLSISQHRALGPETVIAKVEFVIGGRGEEGPQSHYFKNMQGHGPGILESGLS